MSSASFGMAPCTSSCLILICYLTSWHTKSIAQSFLATFLEQLVCRNCITSSICPFIILHLL